MHRHLEIWVFVVFMAMAFFVMGGCKRSKPASKPITNYVESYIVLDFQASDQWKATHSVTATWRNRNLAFPAVFRVTGKGNWSFTKCDDGSCVITVCGDPVTFNIQPGFELEMAIVDGFSILPPGGTATESSVALPPGGKLSSVSYYCLAPVGTTTARGPSEAETTKLLQGSIIDVE